MGDENPCAPVSQEATVLIVRIQGEVEHLRGDMDSALVDIKKLLQLADRMRGFLAALMLLAGVLGGVAGSVINAWHGP